MANANIQLLTNSRRNSYGECPRKHKLRYEDNLTTVKTSEALSFGTLMHLALETWWKTGGDLEEALAIIGVEATKPDGDPYRTAQALVMMRAYHARWAEDLKGMEVLAVEAEFRAPLYNPETGAASRTFELGGKIDAIVRFKDGTVALVEHKTTSESIDGGSDYWSLLSIDGQVSGYYVGARVLGYEVSSCLYDVIKKPSQRPAKATPEESRKYTKEGKLYAGQRETDETPEEFETRLMEVVNADNFARRQIPRSEADLMDYLSDMWGVAANIREAQNGGRWPRNPRSCKNYGGCSYFPLCSCMASASDTSIYITKPAHEELTMKENAA